MTLHITDMFLNHFLPWCLPDNCQTILTLCLTLPYGLAASVCDIALNILLPLQQSVLQQSVLQLKKALEGSDCSAPCPCVHALYRAPFGAG